MNKMLIRCGNCEYDDGQIQTLAEMLPNGLISIRRSERIYTGKHETTLVSGNNFELLCGRCHTPVFRKQQTINFGIIQESFNATIGSI